MTFPRLSSVGTMQEQRLLLSARHDGPSASLRQNILESVGVGGLALTQAPSLGATSQSAMMRLEPPTALAPGASAPVGMAVLVKWVGLASLALMIGTGAGLAVGTAWAERTRVNSINGATELISTRTSRDASEGHTVGDARQTPPVAQAMPTLPQPPPRAPGTSTSRVVRRSPNEQVSEEVHLVDEARRALRIGDAAKCLSALAERQRRFPNGVLGPEASLLRIEGLSLAGQRDMAREEASHFLAQQPTGSLSARVRSVVEMQ